MASEEKYLFTIQKVTSLSGESIQVSFNMPKGASTGDFDEEIAKVCDALDRRLVKQNEKVLALSEATRQAFDQIEAEANGKIN